MRGGASGPMLGRDHELARVMLLLDGALAGGGRLVLCTGEAGIGKTRLAEELAVSLAARGVPVAWARAADRDSMPRLLSQVAQRLFIRRRQARMLLAGFRLMSRSSSG